MFDRIRQFGRVVQVKYEGLISTRSLFGFSDVYADAMRQIKEQQEKRRHN